MENVAEQHILTKCSKCKTFQVISDLLHEIMNFNALKIILKIHKKITRKSFFLTKTKWPGWRCGVIKAGVLQYETLRRTFTLLCFVSDGKVDTVI